jgi:hypothetical protein
VLPTALPLRKRPGTHCTGGWMCVGPNVDLDGCENLAPTGITFPDRTVRSESPY